MKSQVLGILKGESHNFEKMENYSEISAWIGDGDVWGLIMAANETK